MAQEAVRGLSQRKRRQQDRSTQFLNAARDLFFRKGYRGTTMEQIAKSAGYSKRTVYLDYLNKDELFVSVCAEGLELLLDRLKSIPISSLTVEDCITCFLDTLITFSRDHGEYFRMIFSEATPAIIGNCSVETGERVAELERACLSVPVAVVERARREHSIAEIDPWEAAGIFVGAATGIILLSLGGSQTVFSRETLEALVKKAIWTLWKGLQAV